MSTKSKFSTVVRFHSTDFLPANCGCSRVGFDHRHIRIVIGHLRAAGRQQIHQDVTRGLAFVINVWLVRQAKQENSRTVDRFLLRVKGVSDAMHDMLWHPSVDLARQLDETRMLTVTPALSKSDKMDRLGYNDHQDLVPGRTA